MSDKSEDHPYAKYLKLKEPVEFKLSILDDKEQKFWDHMEKKNDRNREVPRRPRGRSRRRDGYARAMLR